MAQIVKKQPDGEIHRYWVLQHPNIYSVKSPSDNSDGACFGCETVCETRSVESADLIADLLNTHLRTTGRDHRGRKTKISLESQAYLLQKETSPARQ